VKCVETHETQGAVCIGKDLVTDDAGEGIGVGIVKPFQVRLDHTMFVGKNTRKADRLRVGEAIQIRSLSTFTDAHAFLDSSFVFLSDYRHDTISIKEE